MLHGRWDELRQTHATGGDVKDRIKDIHRSAVDQSAVRQAYSLTAMCGQATTRANRPTARFSVVQRQTYWPAFASPRASALLSGCMP